MSELDYGFRQHSNATRPSEEITNDAFLPALAVAELAKLYGVPNSLGDEQLKHVLLIAMDRINQNPQLQKWIHEKKKTGASSLLEAGRSYGNYSAAVEQYKRAVYASAKADLLRDQIAIDRKPDAENAAVTGDEMVSYYERQSTRALAELIEQKLIGVHLL